MSVKNHVRLIIVTIVVSSLALLVSGCLFYLFVMPRYHITSSQIFKYCCLLEPICIGFLIVMCGIDSAHKRDEAEQTAIAPEAAGDAPRKIVDDDYAKAPPAHHEGE